MEKLTFNDIKNQSLIDIRSQHDYQNGHLKNSFNLNPKNFNKYGQHLFSFDQPIVFISDEANELETLQTAAREAGFTEIVGYLLIDDVPNEKLQQSRTIPAADFLAKEEDYILLDVRHPDEITRPAPEKNLVNIPLEDIANDLKSLDNNKEIYTLCGSGNRGTSAASYLESNGYKATVIEGGMKAIQESQ